MTQGMCVYSVLIVSASDKFNSALSPLFSRGKFEPVVTVDTVAKARRRMVDEVYDLVVINAPLPDDFGRKLAVDICSGSDTVALILVKNDIYEELSAALSPHGVLVVKKPIEFASLSQLVDVMCSVRERLKGIKKKTMTLEEKMEEIRLVNRAKWALINACHMTEDDAHRYIQKQSMDLCLSKKETAENILRTYG